MNGVIYLNLKFESVKEIISLYKVIMPRKLVDISLGVMILNVDGDFQLE